MKSSIFIPQRIKVGFQKREGTYTGRLAYIIYYDEKGNLRKEKSWNQWIDKNIETIEFENIPISGFVLNKKVGGYSNGWNHRQTYCRVYDERNFEFEISVSNLLYILENTSSIKGKGLDGEFVYGWDGTELILIPTSSPDYVELSKFNEIIHSNTCVKAKDLIVGATYQTKQNEEWIYMGKFNYYGWRGDDKKQFWFYDNKNKNFTQIKSLNGKLINVIDANCCNDYADLFDEMECLYTYSPVDESKVEYEHYDFDYFKETIDNKILLQTYRWAEMKFYCDLENNPKTLVKICRKDSDSNLLKVTKKSKKIEMRKVYWNYSHEYEIEYDEIIYESENIEEIFNKLKPQYKNIYLKNGKLKGGIRNNE